MAGGEVGELTALEENLWDMWAVYGRGDGCVLVDTPELLRFETPIAHEPYNTVARFRGGDRLVDRVDEVLAPYLERGVPTMWELHPSSPPGLGPLLAERGFFVSEIGTGMVAELATVPSADTFPENVTVAQVGPEDLNACIDLVSWRYSLPTTTRDAVRSIMERHGLGLPDCPSRVWLARMDGNAVAQVEVHCAAGVAGLYGVMTRPEARRLGLARNLTALALAQARADGYDTAVLHASPMAVNLYATLGFTKVADFPLLTNSAGR